MNPFQSVQSILMQTLITENMRAVDGLKIQDYTLARSFLLRKRRQEIASRRVSRRPSLSQSDGQPNEEMLLQGVLNSIDQTVKDGIIHMDEGAALSALARLAPGEGEGEGDPRAGLAAARRRLARARRSHRADMLQKELDQAMEEKSISLDEGENLRKMLQMEASSLESASMNEIEDHLDKSLDRLEHQLGVLKEANTHTNIDEKLQQRVRLRAEVEWGAALGRLEEEEANRMLAMLEEGRDVALVDVVARQVSILLEMHAAEKENRNAKATSVEDRAGGNGSLPRLSSLRKLVSVVKVAYNAVSPSKKEKQLQDNKEEEEEQEAPLAV